MSEDFLHYVWKYQQFKHGDLACTGGQSLEIIHPGMHNFNAGPDFLNARIRINNTIWAGNIEIHISASDWYKHKHDTDPAYANVILHVVHQADRSVIRTSGECMPEFSLNNRIDYQSYRYYKSWVKQAHFIPCETLVTDVPSIVKTSAVQSAAIGRILDKAAIHQDILSETNGNIEETFYRILCRSFGLKVNAMPFEHFARVTPFQVVRKVSPALEQLEALFLGQAGFLEHTASDSVYVKEMKLHYNLQKRKYKVAGIPASAWKLFRLRPQNFPAVRLMQLARIYNTNGALAQHIVEAKTVADLQQLFSVSITDGFWLTHFTLEKEAVKSVKSLGADTLELLVINAVVPFLFALATYNKDLSFQEKAIELLEHMKAEKNTVVANFTKLGFPNRNALESQGLLGLKQSYCEALRCLQCKVGITILKNHGRTNHSHL